MAGSKCEERVTVLASGRQKVRVQAKVGNVKSVQVKRQRTRCSTKVKSREKWPATKSKKLSMLLNTAWKPETRNYDRHLSAG